MIRCADAAQQVVSKSTGEYLAAIQVQPLFRRQVLPLVRIRRDSLLAFTGLSLI